VKERKKNDFECIRQLLVHSLLS